MDDAERWQCSSDAGCGEGQGCHLGLCTPFAEIPPNGQDIVNTDQSMDLSMACLNGAPDYETTDDVALCPIRVRVLVDESEGTPVLTDEQVYLEVDFVNEYFAPAGLAFVVTDIIPFSEDAEVHAVTSPTHMTLAFYHPGHEGLQWTDTQGNVSNLCGRASLGPAVEPWAKVAYGCTFVSRSGPQDSEFSTSVHQLGHALSLPHTFGPAGREQLGSDCYVDPAGDRLCDTPPDPKFDKKASSSHGCFATLDPVTDTCTAACSGENLQDYEPNPGLVMSYYIDVCQAPDSSFSPEQMAQMRCTVALDYAALQACDDCAATGCDDGEPCTDDACTESGCSFSPRPDGSSCGGTAVCESGLCLGGSCGDGSRNQPDELCDGSDLSSETCQTQGFESGTLGCTPLCTFDTSACCEAEASSICVGNDVYWQDSCGNTATLKQSCGVDESCVPVDASSSECQTIPPTCGNGALDPGEPCDGPLFAPGSSCTASGFDSGELACNAACSLDASGCCQDDTSYQCFDGDVYWYDSCGNLGTKLDECGQGSCYDTGASTAEREVCPCASGACCDGCHHIAAGTVCQTDAETQFGCPWGTAPGDDVGSRTRDRQCSGFDAGCTGAFGPWSSWSQADACGPDEVCSVGDPTCNPAPCVEPNFWNPPNDADTDPSGLQNGATIPVSVEMEVQQAGSQLEFRVCKLGGVFFENVKVAIYDGATDSTVGINVDLPTAGLACSDWVGLNNDGGYLEGEVFGGIWNLVSPASSAGDWPTWGVCAVAGNPTGTCWSGLNITMTRTCL